MLSFNNKQYKIISSDLKLALMQYYRFNYGCVCAEECSGADILADNGKEIIEVEVKISKQDLIEGEKYKYKKHLNYIRGNQYHNCHPNKFLFCVPEELQEETIKWAIQLNEKYGVIIFGTNRFLEDIKRNRISWANNNCYLTIVKSAKLLHEKYDDKTRWLLAKRITSQATNLMTEKFLWHLRLLD